jgi:hypothetical protein
MPFNGGGAFSFHITGDATGPYTGSFTEDGTGSSTQGFDGPLTAFHATFTINSITPPAVITGTKDLAPGSLSAGQCTPPIYSVQFLNYQAVTPDCVDQGTSDLSFVSDPDPTFFHRFSESFVSLACTPPTNKKCAQATAHADKQCSQHGSDSKQCVKARREQEAAC